MTNILDYLKWRGDLTFTQDPPNAVDGLIFSTLAYIPFGGRIADEPDVPILFRDAAEDYFAMEGYEEKARAKNDILLLRAAADTVRFGYTKLYLYRDLFIPEQDTQFGAVTFLLDDGTGFLAFRGTDNTLVGWKEDFNMSFQQTVPAQRLAVQYTRDVAAEYSAPLRLGGHSKGGNLAVFAAARSSPMVQRQILEVYNNDGPGFTEYLMGDSGYRAMVPRIKTYIPQSSVIGMLLEHEEPYTVIRSKSVGVLQHDPYSWEVMGSAFLTMQEITAHSHFVDGTIKNWCARMTNEERGQVVDVIFDLLSTGDVEHPLDIFHPKNIRTYLKALSSDENLRRMLSAEFQGLLDAMRKTKAQLEESRETAASEDGKELPEGKS